MTKVFVYGTLKQGFGNNRRYLGSSTFIAKGVTVGKYNMIDCGYPVCFQHGDHKVAGEVYEVDDATLSRLDALESVGFNYRRVPVLIFIEGPNGEFPADKITAHMYCGIGKAWGPRRHYVRKVNPSNGSNTLRWGDKELAETAELS